MWNGKTEEWHWMERKKTMSLYDGLELLISNFDIAGFSFYFLLWDLLVLAVGRNGVFDYICAYIKISTLLLIGY
jgi:hypothetical protein